MIWYFSKHSSNEHLQKGLQTAVVGITALNQCLEAYFTKTHVFKRNEMVQTTQSCFQTLALREPYCQPNN